MPLAEHTHGAAAKPATRPGAPAAPDPGCGSAKQPAQPQGRRRAQAGPRGPDFSSLPPAKRPAPKGRGGRLEARDLAGVGTPDRPRGFSPSPRRVLPSLLHLRERSDLIKVIFQEIGRGSQVTAQSVPGRQTQRIPPFAHPVPLRRKEKNKKVTFWSGRALFIPPGREMRERQVGNWVGAGLQAGAPVAFGKLAAP